MEKYIYPNDMGKKEEALNVSRSTSTSLEKGWFESMDKYLQVFPVTKSTKPSQILFQMFSIDSKKPFILVFGGRKGAICKKFGIYVVNSIIKSTVT